MTDTNIIIAVAKLDDKENPTYSMGEWYHYPPAGGTLPRTPMLFNADYLSSRDAIISVIERCINTKEEVWNFSVNLSKILTETDEDYQELSPVDYLSSTPKQLSIALLKATGNYSEDKPL